MANTFTSKKEKLGFDLEKLVKEKAKQVPKEYLNDEYINQQVMTYKETRNNPEFIKLSIVIYRTCFINSTISKTVKKAYQPYCSHEDFFGVFCVMLHKAVDSYNPENGNFKNYFVSMFSNSLKEEKKQGFLKITGRTEDLVNKHGKPQNVPLNTLDISEKYSVEAEQEMMNKQIIEILKHIPNGELLIYKYITSTGKPHSNTEIAKHFNLTLKQVRLRLKACCDAFKSQNPDYFDDYYYDTGNAGEICCFYSKEMMDDIGAA